MNKRITLLSLAGTLALIGSIQAPAQTSAGGTQASTPGTVNRLPATSPVEGTAADRTPPGRTPVRGADAASAPSKVTRMAAADPGEIESSSASTLIGLPVHTPRGEQLGKVEDLLIAPDGHVTDLVLTANETPKGPGNLRAVPWSALSGLDNATHNLVVDKAQLQELPAGK